MKAKLQENVEVQSDKKKFFKITRTGYLFFLHFWETFMESQIFVNPCST